MAPQTGRDGPVMGRWGWPGADIGTDDGPRSRSNAGTGHAAARRAPRRAAPLSRIRTCGRARWLGCTARGTGAGCRCTPRVGDAARTRWAGERSRPVQPFGPVHATPRSTAWHSSRPRRVRSVSQPAFRAAPWHPCRVVAAPLECAGPSAPRTRAPAGGADPRAVYLSLRCSSVRPLLDA